MVLTVALSIIFFGICLFLQKITLLFFMLLLILILASYFIYIFVKTLNGDDDIGFLYITAELSGEFMGLLLLATAIVGYYWFKFL